MTIQEFRNLYDATPFRPFFMHTADGHTVEIKNRDFALPSPAGRTVIVYQPDGSFNVVDLLLVTRLSADPEKPAQTQ